MSVEAKRKTKAILYQVDSVVSNKNAMNKIDHEGTNE